MIFIQGSGLAAEFSIVNWRMLLLRWNENSKWNDALDATSFVHCALAKYTIIIVIANCKWIIYHIMNIMTMSMKAALMSNELWGINDNRLTTNDDDCYLTKENEKREMGSMIYK